MFLPILLGIYYEILPLPTNITSVTTKRAVLVFVFQAPSVRISYSQKAAENPMDSPQMSLSSLPGFISALCIFLICGTEHGTLRKPYQNYKFHRKKTFQMYFFQIQ